MYTRFAVDPHSPMQSIPSISLASSSLINKPAKGVKPNVIALSSRAPPVQQAGRHRTRLDLIRTDLQAYTHDTTRYMGERGHYDDLPAGPSAEHRQIMINALTEGFGYDVDSAICALQLVEYRSVAEAANILMQITVTLSNGGAASPPLQVHTYEYDGEAGETEGDIEASSLATVQSGAGSTQSIATPSCNLIYCNEEQDLYERPFSTGTGYQSRNIPKLLHHGQWGGRANDRPRGATATGTTISLSPDGRWDYFGTPGESSCITNRRVSLLRRSNSLSEPPLSYTDALEGSNISRIQINGATSTASSSGVLNGGRVIKLGRVSSERIQLPRETSQTPLAPVASHHPMRVWQVEKPGPVPYNPSPIQQFGLNLIQPPPGITTSTVVRIISDEGRELRRPNEKSLTTTFGISPNTTPTTNNNNSTSAAASNRSTIYPRRSVSPLPPSIAARLRSGEANAFPSRVKSYKSPMYRFFVEQHVEKLIQQHKERKHRETQLSKEMEAYGAMYGFTESDKRQMLTVLRQKESKYIRLKRQKIDKSMFDIIRQIGVGAFGMVMLARKQDTGQIYAMKVLSKEDVIQKQQLAHVKAERDILAEANSNWVVKLFFSFQDSQNLYFVLEYVPGGDMMQLLITKGIFSERLARFYIAELACALEYVHSLGFIHRDIKPDNILIDKHGHIKLTDFGLCTGLRWTHDKRHYVIYDEQEDGQTLHYRNDSFSLPQNLNQKGNKPKGGLLEYRHQKKRNEAHSVVGTGNYMAPEVISKIGHTQMCDWWSVGVICYEMVYGRPPFLSLNECADETQYMIVNWRNYLDINNNPMGARLSRPCKEFISRLCCDQDARMGCREGAREIKHHAWFKGIDFANLRNTRAEYIPRVRHEEDTSNFDACEVDSKELFKEVRGKRGSKGYNPAFYDFTFRHFFSFDGDRPSANSPSTSRHPHRPGLAPLVELKVHELAFRN